jgi:DNA repair photolyase
MDSAHIPASGKSVDKTRGATLSPPSRYLARITVPVDDGWQPQHTTQATNLPAGGAIAGGSPERREERREDEFSRSGPSTELLPDRTVRLITRNRSPDIGFDRSINAYKGCEHGCVYCFARPTHAYLDLSPGLDFETKIFYKTRVRANLEAELAGRKYTCRTIAMGTNTDPYQPAERDKRITREILEVLLAHRHPVSIVTKSQLILRDLDLLEALAEQELINVHVSVTTLDNTLKTRLEPRTAGPAARLKTIRSLRAAGIPTGAMVAPVIPFINDAELEDIVAACVDAGASALGYILLRLPLEVAPMFHSWLERYYPLKTERVENALRSARGGKLYQAQWGQRMVGSGPIAELLRTRFARSLRHHGLEGKRLLELRTDRFAVPNPQESLF